jgi:plastocyanin
MRRLLSLGLLILAPSFASAATLIVNVHTASGRVPSDAVVFAVPEGRKLPLAKKTAVMDQKNRTFVPHILPIQTGASVSFPNSDEVHHQVYSFSATKAFQLPLYKGTPANPVSFPRSGVVPLGCYIHDRMSAYIVVVDTPYFTMLPASGRAELADVAEGRYAVHVWSPGSGDGPPSIVTVDATGRPEITVVTRK